MNWELGAMIDAIFSLSILRFLVGVENTYLTLKQLFWCVQKKFIQVSAQMWTNYSALPLFSHNFNKTMKEK